MPPEKGRAPGGGDDLLDWFTVSYRTIYLVAGVLIAAGAGWYWFSRGKTDAVEHTTPPPTAAATTARFTSLDGSIKVKPRSEFEWLTADRNMVLKKGDLVRTGSGAAAEITFFDGTVVHVRPDSLITIEETSENPQTRQRRVAWHISSGEVNFQTAKKNVDGSSTEITTPVNRLRTSDEAQGGIRVENSGDSDIRIFKGTDLQVETKTGEKVSLSANESIKVDPSGNVGPKLKLPGIPTLLAPPHQTEIAYIDLARATTLLVWKPVAEATTYHVVVDYSASFNRPLVDRRGVKDASVELRGLDVGKYFWRVSAIDRDDVEGEFSPFARFSVTKPAAAVGEPPPLAIEAFDVRTNILQIRGRTEPGAGVTVNGQALDVQPDGSFNEFITLDKAGRQDVVIRSVGINGGINEQKRPVVVAF